MGHDSLIKTKQLLTMVPYTIQHISRLEKAGKFPRRVKVGEKRVAWVLSEVNAWMKDRMGERTLVCERSSSATSA